MASVVRAKMFVLALCIASSSAPALAHALGPVIGDTACSILQVGPRVVEMQCSDMVIKAMKPVTYTFEAILEKLMVEKGWQPASIVQEGKEIQAAMGVRADGKLDGFAAGSVVSGIPMVFVCHAKIPQQKEYFQCREIVKDLVAHGLPEGVAFAGSSLNFSGVALEVPDGCILVEGQNRIRCAQGELHWRDPQGKCTSESQKVEFQKLLERVGTAVGSAVPCSFMGQSETCQKYLLQVPNQPDATIITYMVGCSRPTAQCNLWTQFDGTYPEPCDQLFGTSEK